MSHLKSATHLSICGLLVVASACGHPRKPRRDASVDPAQTTDAGVCSQGVADSGECNGAVQVNLDFCDRASIEVTPLQTLLDSDITLLARAKDSDQNGLSVEWSAEPDGSFGDDESAVTTYRCESLGRKTIRMVAMDDRGCESRGEVEVSCVADKR